MCSRYSLTSPAEAVRRMFDVPLPEGPLADPPPRYNIAPTQPIAIVRTRAAGAREMVLVRWGLLPGWVKDPAKFTTLINARAETIAEKPSFRTALRHRRCIVPADAFYEWMGEKGAKRPFLIRPRADGPLAAPLGFAGLWEHWQSPDGSEMESAAIITVAANATVATVHDRMPAILAPEDFDAWLDVRSVRDATAAEMLRPAGADVLELFEIGRRIGNSRFDDPALQQPLQPTDH